MVSQRAREKITFARLLEAALVEEGHTVLRHPLVDENADLVIVGVTSALSPAATYALSGLEMIGRALEADTPLLLFADDPALGKTRYGATSARDKPDRLYTDYLMAKRVRSSATVSLEQRRMIRQAIWMLAGERWPTVLLPLHPWARTELLSKKLGIVSDVAPLDVSSLMNLPDPAPPHEQAQMWLTDRHYSSRMLEPGRTGWPVVPINSRDLDNPTDVYAAVCGVHQGLIADCPGWWTPTPQYVATAGAVYLMDGGENNLVGSGTPYYLTPDYVESLGLPYELAESQRDYLKEAMWDRSTLSSRLADVTGSNNSSQTPDTKTPTSATS